MFQNIFLISPESHYEGLEQEVHQHPRGPQPVGERGGEQGRVGRSEPPGAAGGRSQVGNKLFFEASAFN